jgi:spermidine synthase
VHDVQESLKHARRASELSYHKDPDVLDTLATAYAAAGHFDEAVAVAGRALQLAEARELPTAEQLRRRLEMFRRKQPYIAPATTATTSDPRNQ